MPKCMNVEGSSLKCSNNANTAF